MRARESLLCCMQHEATRAHTCQHEWGSPSRQRITHEIRARTASMHTPRRIQTKTIQHRRVVPCRHRPCRARRFTHTCTHNHLRPHAHPPQPPHSRKWNELSSCTSTTTRNLRTPMKTSTCDPRVCTCQPSINDPIVYLYAIQWLLTFAHFHYQTPISTHQPFCGAAW